MEIWSSYTYKTHKSRETFWSSAGISYLTRAVRRPECSLVLPRITIVQPSTEQRFKNGLCGVNEDARNGLKTEVTENLGVK